MFKTLIRNLRKRKEEEDARPAMLDTLRGHVREAFENAAANGCSFAGWTDHEVAADMWIYDADIETFKLDDVFLIVKELRPAIDEARRAAA